MPIYEYECCQCGDQTEAWQKFSDPPLTQCVKCHGKLRKLISQSSFHLKGAGWYVTDYASKSGNKGGKEEKSPATKAETPSTESKEPSAKKTD